MSSPAISVSVALCTHNGERFIVQQIVSILNQSVTPDEIVLSDDASSDATVALASATVDEWRREHPVAALEFRVLQNARSLGVTGNFEQAILATRGEFVALSDQDDLWRADRVERVLELMRERPELTLVHSDARLIDAENNSLDDSLFSAHNVNPAVVSSIHEGRAFDILARRTVVTGAATMIRRRLAELAAPFPGGWVHDEWLAIVAAARGEIDVIDEQLIDYRQHGANEIGAGTLSFLGKLRRMLQPGTERNRRLLERAAALEERFATMPDISSQFVRASVQKHEHERVRSALSPHRLSRLLPVLRELRTGRYSAFGRGAADAVRDLLQPLRPSG